jgi:preprotein translocase subunit SecD
VRKHVIMLTCTVVLIVGTFVATLLSDDRPVLGLDLQGGLSVVLKPVEGSDFSTLDAAAQIMRNRVDGIGIAEPEVSRQGNSIVVDLPGAKNQQKALELVQKTSELRFRPVQGVLPYSSKDAVTTTTVAGGSTTTVAGGSSTTTTPTTAAPSGEKQSLGERAVEMEPIAARRPEQAGDTTTTAPGGTSTTVKGATTTTTVPPVANDGTCQDGKLVTPPEQNTADAQTVILVDRKHEYCYLLGPTLMTGRGISGADAVIRDASRGWEVEVKFKNDDFVKKVAEPYVNQQVAISLDEVVQSAPTINPGITGTDVQITGNFSQKEAKDLALNLRYGSLPVVFTTATSQAVSPTLGKDQLRAGIIAGVIGLALVMLYMIFFYRLLGLVVWVGLGLTGMLFFTLITWMSTHNGTTLTLAGVTGIIVSVGVTVDSYVVYFERLKDEVRTGKTVRSSVEVGFHRSFRTILAADLVSILGALVLYALTSGSVKFFALFLAISTGIDLVLAYFFMYPLVVIMARRPALVRMRGIGIAAGLDVPEAKA